MPKITKKELNKKGYLNPKETGDRVIWESGDGALKGFGIRIKPSGIASYIIQYRNSHGQSRRMTVGRVGVLTPDEARSLAMDKLGQAAKGHDPVAQRRSQRSAITVADLCDMYLADVKGVIKESTWKNDKSRIECHVKPLLGSKVVSSLGVQDIERFQAAIAAGKTAKKRADGGRSGLQRGGRGVAARTVGMFSTIMEFARRRGIIAENPAKDVRKYPDNKRQRFLSEAEIQTFGEALNNQQSGATNKIAINAIRLLLLTGCRKSEILSLTWDEVDLKARCFRFKDTKSGAQIRPAGAAAIQLLDDLPRTPKWVFQASRGDGHFIGLPRVFEKICQHTEIEGATLHTLRHTFAAMAAELGFSELTIAGMLGHSVPGVTARYAHMPDRALIAAADAVSSHIAFALDGKKSAENVLSMISAG